MMNAIAFHLEVLVGDSILTMAFTEFAKREALPLWRRIPSQAIHLTVVFVVAFGYGLYYWSIYGWRPGVWQVLGYQGWADQSSYLIELRYLSQFQLPATPEEYLRGPGYPLTGVPFEWLGFTVDPLFPANLLMLAITACCTFVLGARLSSSRVIAYVAVGTLLFASPLVELVIVPWSTTVTLVALSIALVIATSPRGITTSGSFWLGGLAGWTFAARFLDVVAIAFLCLWYLFSGSRRFLVRRLIAMAAPAITWVLFVGISQLVVHGSFFSTGYTRHTGNPQSLGYYSLWRIPRSFWQTFVTGTGDDGRSEMDPLFVITPLLALLVMGIWLVLRRRTPLRSLHFVIIVGSLIQGSIYLAGEFSGGDALHFRSPRFWISSYPYWIILSLLAAVWIFRTIETKRVSTKPSA